MRARDAAELRDLFERVRSAHAASAFARPKAIDRIAFEMVMDACRRAGGVAMLPLGEPLLQLAQGLIAEDGLLQPPVVASFDDLTIEQCIALRKRLGRQAQFLADTDRLFDIWYEKAVRLMQGILGYLPDGFRVDAEEAAQEDAPAPLSAPLIDLCNEPATVIERTIATFFDDDVVQAELFEAVRDRFNHNILVASGINPENAGESTKALRFPSGADLPPMELVRTYLGGTAFASFFETRLPFLIPFPARFEHTHIVGGSGHGKTQLLQSMVYDDLLAAEDGRTLIVIDSQGDLIKTISHLACFGPEGPLSDRLVLIDPTDIAFPVCLNLFDWGGTHTGDAVEREKQLNSAIALYEYIFGALLGAELTQKQGVIFKYLARLMLEIPDATIHTLGSLMENGEPFRPYMERLEGSARQFFATRFFDRSFNETKKQILTRLWGVLSNGTLERVFGNARNKVDIFGAMQSGKVVLINTAKDFLTRDGSAFLGRFFIALIAQAAVQRAALPAHKRAPCFVYIDEAAEYFDDTVGSLLNQARKYKVGLVLAHQNLDQLSTELRASLMASTSIKFAGGVSSKDARALADEMHCDAAFLQGMRKRKTETDFACFVRYFTPHALSVTVPLGRVEREPSLTEPDYHSIIERNRARYCVPLAELHAKRSELLPPVAYKAERTPPKTRPGIEPEPPRFKAPSVIVGPELPKADSRPVARPEPPTGNEPVVIPPPPIPPPVPEPDAERESIFSAPLPAPDSKPVVPEKPALPAPLQVEHPAKLTTPSPPLGRGGKQHQYLQHFIKEAAQQRGWLAVIEESILDGAGKIDVSLKRGDRRVACEISVTSPKDQELGNVEKCLAAGVHEILLVASSERQRAMLRKYIGNALDDTEREKVRFLIPDEVLIYLDSQNAPTEQTIRGYRVTVQRNFVDAEDMETKRQAIAAVIARSLKRSK